MLRVKTGVIKVNFPIPYLFDTLVNADSRDPLGKCGNAVRVCYYGGLSRTGSLKIVAETTCGIKHAFKMARHMVGSILEEMILKADDLRAEKEKVTKEISPCPLSTIPLMMPRLLTRKSIFVMIFGARFAFSVQRTLLSVLRTQRI